MRLLFAGFPHFAVFFLGTQAFGIPEDGEVSFNREVLEDPSPRSEQVWPAASMGASHEDRRKRKDHIVVGGGVSVLCEFGHLLAEVSS